MLDPSHFTLPLPIFSAPPKILIIRAPYYKEIADYLYEGARAKLTQTRATIGLVDVPGALEIAPALKFAQGGGEKYDGYVALGCVIRGQTSHYETVCEQSAGALTELGLEGLAIGNGILSVENYDQALERARPDAQDKGGGAAHAALHLIALRNKFQSA